MKKFGLTVLSTVVAVASFAALAQAQSDSAVTTVNTDVLAQGVTTPVEESDLIDLAALTCRDFLKTAGEEQANLMIFMHGYMSGVSETTTVDGPALAIASDNIIDGCIDSPDETLFSMFEANR